MFTKGTVKCIELVACFRASDAFASSCRGCFVNERSTVKHGMRRFSLEGQARNGYSFSDRFDFLPDGFGFLRIDEVEDANCVEREVDSRKVCLDRFEDN